MIISKTPISRSQVKDALKKGSRFIAPLWSLENFVAVNAYMGMADMPFVKAMDFMSKSSKANGTLTASFYLDALAKGKLTQNDIARALEDNKLGLSENADKFLKDLYQNHDDNSPKVQTLADTASQLNGKKWNRFMVDRISFWASAYFDHNQAIWKTAEGDNALFEAWKREAEIDYAPEVTGLKGFRKYIQSLPDNYLDAVALALDELQISEELMDHYLNSLLMKMNGWAGFAAKMDWDAGLKGKESHVLQEFLAIMIVWELALLKLLKYEELESGWQHARLENLQVIKSDAIEKELAQRLILQQAFDIAHQRTLIQKINAQQPNTLTPKTPKFQAIFCIDVRSEVFRRNIEAVNSDVETLGFAGFFAFPIKYVQLGHDTGSDQCPALLSPAYTIRENVPDSENVTKKRSRKVQLQKALKAFKKGAISCFGFVSPLGIFFLPKLISDSLGLSRPESHPGEIGLSKQDILHKGVEIDPKTELVSGIPLEDRVKMAANALKAMSLTKNFASVVLITGHGSTTTNNPHASGLDCGACGGNSGEANAKVAAAVLNDQYVRESLKKQGIEIPDTTLFVAALHDTTSDEVTIFKPGSKYHSAEHDAHLNELSHSLKLAGEKAREERGGRMKISNQDIQKEVLKRSKDWSQVRPEWGLAGCSSFIVAPRERTAQLNLDGRAFMHNYDWKQDKGFGVLELIMTAPMVVTSWINLQYYASTVDNKVFGAGNKVLHNVVGGVGVLEGFAGDLRVGLPLQSVNDGENYQHEPQRLNVMIEAPVDQMSKILQKHESIRHLVDNEWIYLFAINDEGKVAYKYVGDLEWEVVS